MRIYWTVSLGDSVNRRLPSVNKEPF
jgi:catechol 2,3-dioxygenase-like lactoylglutathione lyase family enzyme